eukprot:73604_1
MSLLNGVPRIYAYKLTAMYRDVPCIQDKLLSIAYCQGQMRRLCQIDDIIFGFGSKSEKNNGDLLFCAQITNIIESPFYYNLYPNRRDCVYHYDDKEIKMTFVANRDHEYFEKRYHTNIGNNMEKARVLLSESTSFRTFFHVNDPNICLYKYPHIIEYMKMKTRGPFPNPMFKDEFYRLFEDIINCRHYTYEKDPNEYDPKTSRKSKLNPMIPVNKKTKIEQKQL